MFYIPSIEKTKQSLHYTYFTPNTYEYSHTENDVKKGIYRNMRKSPK